MAWTWLDKLRRAMVPPRSGLLKGRVEVAEYYVGGLEAGFPSRLNLEKTLIVIGAQEFGSGISCICMRQIGRRFGSQPPEADYSPRNHHESEQQPIGIT
jgi:hypothetical protein